MARKTILVIVFFAGMISRLTAQKAGDLDTDFNQTGKNIYPLSLGSDPVCETSLTLPNGRTLLAGKAGDGIRGVVITVKGDGELYTGFAADGFKYITRSGHTEMAITGLAYSHAQNRVYAFGRSKYNNLTFLFITAFSPDNGNTDLNFGSTNGFQFISGWNSSHYPGEIKLQNDGKIVTVSRYNIDGEYHPVILRFASNGLPDDTFYPNYHGIAYINGLAIQNDGKLIMSGSKNGKMAAVRLHIGGSVDTAFGNNGEVEVPLNSSEAFTVVITKNNKILLAGFANTSQPQQADFAFAQLHLNGELDISFGNGGTQLVNFNGKDEYLKNVLLQPDGKIIAAGYTVTAATPFPPPSGTPQNTDIAIVRLTENGQLDTDFSGDGKLKLGYENGKDDYFGGISLQRDGKIIVSGTSAVTTKTSNVGSRISAFRLHGVSDFATLDGAIYRTINKNSDWEDGYAISVSDQGKIVVALDVHADSIAVHRFLSTGKPDATFSTDGYASFKTTGLVLIKSIHSLPDGKILVAGNKRYVNGDYAPFVCKINENGDLDASFGGTGIMDFNLAEGEAMISGALLLPSGTLILGGEIKEHTGGSSSLLLMSILPNGSLNPAFGINGKVISDPGPVSGSDYENVGALTYADGYAYLASTKGTLFYIRKYSSTTGALVPGFGTQGKFTNSGTSPIFITHMAYHPQTGLCVTGSEEVSSESYKSVIYMITPTGTGLNTAFAGTGKILGLWDDNLVGVEYTETGGILVAGNYYNGTPTLILYGPNGTYDPAINGDGILIPQTISYEGESIRAMSAIKNGKVYTTGNYNTYVNSYLTVRSFPLCKYLIASPLLTHPANDVQAGTSSHRLNSTIEAANWLLPQSSSRYEATRSILLTPGFEVKEGAVLLAKVNTCHF